MTPIRPLFVATLLVQAAGRPLAQAPAAAPLFSSYNVFALRLEAPFDELFQHSRDDDSTYHVAGRLSYEDAPGHQTATAVEISVRGHTSRQESECSFPKLKVHFLAAGAGGPAFAGLKSFKIGTHCADQPDNTLTAKYGRVGNETAPHREAFVYRLLDKVGVPALKARPARITYVFSKATGAGHSQVIARDAMLLEENSTAVTRLGGTDERDPALFTNAREEFDPLDAALLAFAEAMIGNFDWCLKFFAADRYRCDARHPLWNIAVAVREDGRKIPFIYDFDLAGMVTGRHDWFSNVFNAGFAPSKSHAEVEVLAQVQRTRSLFARPTLDAARARLLRHKSDAFRALDQADVDEQGSRQIEQYLRSFFDAIDTDARFYIPAVARPGLRPYADAEAKQPVCASQGTVPVGTPVGRPLGTRGKMVQVLLLDVMWHWAPPVRSDGVRKGPIWLNRVAIDSRYPLAERQSGPGGY